MTVTNDETVCYFVVDEKWSTTEDRPKNSAFRGADLSVWRQEKLTSNGASLDDLRIGPFAGSRHVTFTVAKVLELAAEAEFPVRVVRRTEDKYVKPEWRRWRYAHAQIEEDPLPPPPHPAFPPEFRLLLVHHAQKP